MLEKLYKPRNLASLAGHYGAAGAIVAGTLFIAQPWAWAVAAVLVGGLSYASIRSQKKFLENNLVEYPKASDISPKLGEIAADLYKKSGLKAEGNPIYDFQPDKDKIKKNKLSVSDRLAKMQGLVAQTHNAAALQLGKPVIMISKPLLKLLDDNEEKAVLAHEFAHAASRHQHATLPQRLILGVAASAAGLTLIGAMVSLGWAPVLCAIGASVVSGIAFRKAIGAERKELLSKEDDDLTLPELARKKKLVTGRKLLGTVTTTAVLGFFSPAFLALYGVVKGIGATSKVLSASFSRSIEYQADRGAVTLGADPLALVTGLRKIEIVAKRSKEKAFDGNLPKAGYLKKIWNSLTVDHPSTSRRIDRLCKMAKKQGVSQDLIEKAAKSPIEIPAENDIPYEVIKSLACRV
ncbi:MAG: hypothetical protein EPN97_07835 [Alphaproteobacteria bacterium]|nr:MAG: hypothetical protein EPN97_07835 [Alphaproteobacteria bacterium]